MLSHGKRFGAIGHRTVEIATLDMTLHMLLEQRLLIKAAGTYIAFELELIVHLQMLIEMRLLQKLLITFAALVGERLAVSLHVRVQLRLQLEVLLRTAWTIVSCDAGMRLQMLIQRGNLCELLAAHVAAILLHLVV